MEKRQIILRHITARISGVLPYLEETPMPRDESPKCATSASPAGCAPLTLLEAAQMALDETVALQAKLNDALGLPQSINGVAILVEDAIRNHTGA